MSIRRHWKPAVAVAAVTTAALLAGCAVGPDYGKPALDMPVTWKLEAPWREATPNDAAPKGSWWERFGDSRLNALQEQAIAGNATLAAAGARLEQSRAVLAGASAGQFPQAGVGFRANRIEISSNRPLNSYASPQFSTVQNDFVPLLQVGYELDVFGRVRRTIEGARASAQQSAIDLENVRLLISADLAAAYFSLRALDIELDVLSRSIALQRRSLQLVTDRHDLGAASGLDVAQQQALLDSTLTQVDLLRRQRSVFEHAIATLTGTPAPVFSLAADLAAPTPPAIPLGVPSDVLERRPDVASAERAMAVANAQIGIATAAFFPSINLFGTYGYESRDIDTLFATPSFIWSAGVSVFQPLFDAGRIQANVDFTKAGYSVTLANYRRIVLTAMQEVQDGITGLARLDSAYAQAAKAIASANRALDLATARYEGGISTYLEVIVAQQALLNNERLAAQLLGQRMLASVFLVKALGGDWPGAKGMASAQPKPETAAAR
jgi:NodT family efflux transporter outer membrane factor (OMF) lipoprotein